MVQDEIVDIDVGRLCGSDIVQVAHFVRVEALVERMKALQKWLAVYLMFQKLCASRVDQSKNRVDGG